MYYDRRGTDKNHPGQNLPDRKDTGQNSQNKNSRELRQTPVKTYVRLCMHVLLKFQGPRCVTYFMRGVSRCVTKCDRGRGSKLVQNSVTYFMDGPSWAYIRNGVPDLTPSK